MCSRNSLALLALTLWPTSAFAQSPTEPPTYLRFLRSGRGTAVPQTENYAAVQAEVIALAAYSITGPIEDWRIELHDSFASIEALDQKLNLSADARIGLYLPGLSYRPDQAVRNIPKARYLSISTYRIQTGADTGFAEFIRARRIAYDAVNLDRPEMVYRIMSGDYSGTYMILAPLPSLRMMDNGQARNPAYAEATTDGGAAANRKLAADTILSRENTLFRIQPSLSYVPADFWAPAPQQ